MSTYLRRLPKDLWFQLNGYYLLGKKCFMRPCISPPFRYTTYSNVTQVILIGTRGDGYIFKWEIKYRSEPGFNVKILTVDVDTWGDSKKMFWFTHLEYI